MQYFIVENSLVDDLDDWPAHLDILFDLFRHYCDYLIAMSHPQFFSFKTGKENLCQLDSRYQTNATLVIHPGVWKFLFQKKEICAKRTPA